MIESDASIHEAVDRLASSRDPLLVGVRHHSPALAAALPALLEAAQPTLVAIELPTEYQPWLAHLGHPELEPPVALAGASREGSLSFHPFAELSPELVAVRWAVAHGVAMEAIDLPLDRRPPREAARSFTKDAPSLMGTWLRRTGADDFEELWDRAIEARAPGSSPEAIRRAALALGWALREDADCIARLDRHREAHMRACLERARARGETIVAVIGAFHAPALLAEPLSFVPPEDTLEAGEAPATSLIAYDDELLDSRSGYPAGIRDPRWQRRWLEALVEGGPSAIEALCARVVSEVSAEVRARGHVAGVPDTREALRLALDLARLRGLPAPARRELLEAIETALARGERLGRGRVLARALDAVMVGRRRGRLAPGTPRSGLVPHVEALLDALGLPRTSTEPTTLRLDPLRSPLDRRRELTLRRLHAAGVPYSTPRAGVAAGGIETLTRVWDVRWHPGTEGSLALASTRGVTLEQATEGILRARARDLDGSDALTAAARIALLVEAAECGLARLTREWMIALAGPFLEQAGLAELLDAIALVERITRGHVPGLPREDDDARGDVPAFEPPIELRVDALIAAAVAALEGTIGSDRIDDARALLALVRHFEREPDALGTGRLGWVLARMMNDGSPLMQGAAGAVRASTGLDEAHAFGERMAGWIDGATDAERARVLSARMKGALVVAGPLFEADASFSGPMVERVEALDDDAFLQRLPAMREGFEVASPASRARLLAVLGERHGMDAHHAGLDVRVHDDPAWLAIQAEADAAARAALEPLGLTLEPIERTSEPSMERASRPHAHRIAPVDRWRLLLGSSTRELPSTARPIASALDELYGAGRGEGSREWYGGGGREAPFVSTREWAEALEGLFGKEVRDEVLARAAALGRPAALTALDADEVTPSIDLLEQVLSLKGGLSDAQLAPLRRLIARVVRQLAEELAVRLRPALFGVTTARPTYRPSGRLDLRRTVHRNLHTARVDESGMTTLVPERLVFASRAQRHMDQRVILVVDVSGSMEASTIYSAMVAAILSGAPWVDVRFLAFSTEVIDLSERVDDPLGLLLEVRVGGGTHIAKGLRAARNLVKVPQRTVVIVVSDFEEGFEVSALLGEVRALVTSGVRALGVAALDDRGEPRYCRAIAEQVVAAGMPVAALTPLELARWIGEKLRS